jgi:hypothetical protein
MQYEIRFLWALVLTVVVEGAVIIAVLRFSPLLGKRKISWIRCIVAGSAPSFATLPYLWFILPLFLQVYPVRTIVGEITIVIVEAVLLRYLVNLKRQHAALLSFIANGVSVVAGLLVFK